MLEYLMLIKGDIRHRIHSFARWWEQLLKTWTRFRVIPWGLFMVALLIVTFPPSRAWANDNPGAMTAAAALVAAIFATITLDLVSQGREAVYVSQEQYAAQIMPVLAFALEPGATLEHIPLKVSNIGSGPALNIRFYQRPPKLVLAEKMDESSPTVPLSYNIQTSVGGSPLYSDAYSVESSVFPLRAGAETPIYLESASELDDILNEMREHVLYGGEHEITHLGLIVATYENVNQVEMHSIGVLEWHLNPGIIVLAESGVNYPRIRPHRVLGVDTTYWQRSPKILIHNLLYLRKRRQQESTREG